MGLGELVRGIIDKDNDNPEGDGVYRLGRYSIENYLLDPIVVYAAMLDEGCLPPIEGVPMFLRGEEHKLRSLDQSVLQLIVDYITEQAATSLGVSEPAHERSDVSFISGQSLNYPKWQLDRNLKKKLTSFQSLGTTVCRNIDWRALRKAFERVALIQCELRHLMERLQAPEP